MPPDAPYPAPWRCSSSPLPGIQAIPPIIPPTEYVRILYALMLYPPLAQNYRATPVLNGRVFSGPIDARTGMILHFFGIVRTTLSSTECQHQHRIRLLYRIMKACHHCPAGRRGGRCRRQTPYSLSIYCSGIDAGWTGAAKRFKVVSWQPFSWLSNVDALVVGFMYIPSQDSASACLFVNNKLSLMSLCRHSGPPVPRFAGLQLEGHVSMVRLDKASR